RPHSGSAHQGDSYPDPVGRKRDGQVIRSPLVMCELLGMSANVPTDICFSFTGLMLRGGKTGPHKDGWGITFYEGRGFRTFKDPEPSAQSPIAKLVQALPIKSRAVVSHIRQ